MKSSSLSLAPLLVPLLAASPLACGDTSSNDGGGDDLVDPGDTGTGDGDGDDSDGGDLDEIPPQCGDMAGLQADALWPAPGYCGANPRRSPRPFPTATTAAWTFAPGGSLGVTGTPAVDADGSIYVAATDDGTHASLIKLDSGGNELWRYDAPATLGQGAVASPVLVANGTIVFGTDTAIIGVDDGGQQLWTVPLDQTLASADLGVGPDGTVYAAAGELVAIGPDGQQTWAAGAADVYVLATVVASDGSVYAFGKGELYDDGILFKFDPSGNEAWSGTTELDALGRYVTPMVRADGSVIFPFYGATVAVTADGALAWAFPLMPGAIFEPSGATLTSDDETVVSVYYGEYQTVFLGAGGIGEQIGGCRTVLLSDPDGVFLCALDTDKLGLRGTRTADYDIDASDPLGAAVGDPVLYVASGGTLFAVGP